MTEGLTRKQFLSGASGAMLHAGLEKAGIRESRSRRPNVLIVMADEWRAQAFGFAGDRNAHTTAFDRFHAESVSFSQAVSGTPVCCPARASLMTGQYPLTNGVYINDVTLQPNCPTLGEVFGNEGYHTGYIGKWHLYGSPGGKFERRLAYVPPDQRLGFQYWKACECTHDYNHSLYYAGVEPTPHYWEGYDAIAQTNDAISFINDRAAKNDPFLLFLAWGPPHYPYSAPEQYAKLYADRDIAFRPNVPTNGRVNAAKELRGYYAAIAVLNDCFGRLMRAVEAAEAADDTIVLFLSDHGEMGGSQDLMRKLCPWEESIRVPLMVRYPRKLGRKARSFSGLVNMPDIMPTLLGLAGISVPHGIQGHDYSRTLTGQCDQQTPSSAYLSLPVPTSVARNNGFDAYRGVRTDRYTFVRTRDKPWLLYDNLRDPYQMRNLINDDQMRHEQVILQRELDHWQLRLGDEFMPPQYYVERDGLGHYSELKAPLGHTKSPWGDWDATL